MEKEQVATEDVTVLGWYDHANIGDESYKLAFPKIFPNKKFNFVSSLKGDEKKIILGGGNVLNSHFDKELRKCPDAVKYAMSVDFGNFPVGADEYKNIIARSNVSNDMGLDVKRACDFAFILEEDRNKGAELLKEMFAKQGCELYSKIVIIVMNSFLCVRQGMLARDQLNFDKVCQELATLCDDTSASFVFLPFGNGWPHNDRIANSLVYSKCKFWKKNLLVYNELDVQSTLDICAAANVVISTRLHSSIFAAISKTPFIDLCHHAKTKSFMNWYGCEDWMFDYWHLDYNGLKEKVEHFFDTRSSVYHSLKARRQGCYDMLAALKDEIEL